MDPEVFRAPDRLPDQILRMAEVGCYIITCVFTSRYCVWFRDGVWTKIWSSIMLLDIRPWSVVQNDSVYFAGANKGNPYKHSTIFPLKKVSVPVFQ